MANSMKIGDEAEIYVNKLEAARRQIDAAVRMFLANEDSLAIHTVTAAGYTVLRDLFKRRGKYDLEELLKAGIYQCALEYAEGRITQEQIEKFYEGDFHHQDMIIRLAKEIKEGRVLSLEETGVQISIPDAARKIRHDNLAKIPNFLKHADKDPQGFFKC